MQSMEWILFFRLITTEAYFSFLAAGFCPKNSVFVQKRTILQLAESAPSPPRLVRLWWSLTDRIMLKYAGYTRNTGDLVIGSWAFASTGTTPPAGDSRK